MNRQCEFWVTNVGMRHQQNIIMNSIFFLSIPIPLSMHSLNLLCLLKYFVVVVVASMFSICFTHQMIVLRNRKWCRIIVKTMVSMARDVSTDYFYTHSFCPSSLSDKTHTLSIHPATQWTNKNPKTRNVPCFYNSQFITVVILILSFIFGLW